MIVDNTNYLGWELAIEFEVALDRDELNFDKSFLDFNIKNKNIGKICFQFECKH